MPSGTRNRILTGLAAPERDRILSTTTNTAIDAEPFRPDRICCSGASDPGDPPMTITQSGVFSGGEDTDSGRAGPVPGSSEGTVNALGVGQWPLMTSWWSAPPQAAS